MRTVRRVDVLAELGPTYDEWQTETFFEKHFVDREIYVAPRPRSSTPFRVTEWLTALKIIAFVSSVIAVLAWAGMAPVPFRP